MKLVHLPGHLHVGVKHDRHATRVRQQLHQDFLSLAVELGREKAESGGVAAMIGDRANVTLQHHVVGDPDDRDRLSRGLRSADRY